MAGTYTAKDILVLEGLEAGCGGRPAMYIGRHRRRPGSHHLLWEIVDNSVGPRP